VKSSFLATAAGPIYGPATSEEAPSMTSLSEQRGARGARRAAILAAALGAVALLVPPAASAAAGGVRQYATFTFTSTKPHHRTAQILRVTFVNPTDPQAKPPVIKNIDTIIGGRYDTSVPGHCKATDQELLTFGNEACPLDSIEGVGFVTVDTGYPGPNRFFGAPTDFFSNTNEIIGLSQARLFTTGPPPPGWARQRQVTHAVMTSNKTINPIPYIPVGTPPDGGALASIFTYDYALSKGSGKRTRAYITTPAHCPRSHEWVNKLIFTYGDGVTQTVDSPTPCKPLKKKHRKPPRHHKHKHHKHHKHNGGSGVGEDRSLAG
jgi:hypothetical protein